MKSRMIDFFKILINLGISRMIVRMTVAAEDRLLFNGDRALAQETEHHRR